MGTAAHGKGRAGRADTRVRGRSREEASASAEMVWLV